MAEKMRSPNFPGFGLSEAILKVRQLYEQDKRAAVPRETAVAAWGYRGLNGASLRALGALRQYGLLEAPSPGMVKVTGDALALLLEPEGSSEYRGAISSVAMRPAIFRALHKQYPDGLPSDGAIVAHLVRTANFGEDAARSVIASYRDTLALAMAAGNADTSRQDASDNGASGGQTGNSGDRPPTGGDSAVSAKSKPGAKMEFTWPLSGDVTATLTVSRAIESDDIETLRQYFEIATKALRKAAASQIPTAPVTPGPDASQA